MAIAITCHSCGTNLRVPDNLLGSAQGVKCPKCGTVSFVPTLVSPTPAQPEPVWYLARNNKKLGPFSSSQLQQMVQTGQLRPADMVLRHGTPKWVPATSVPELFPDQSPSQEGHARVPQRPPMEEAAVLTPRKTEPKDDQLERMNDDVMKRAEEAKSELSSMGHISEDPDAKNKSLAVVQAHDRLLSGQPVSWKLWYSRGLWVAYAVGDANRGLEDLDRALSLCPDSVRIRQAIEELRSHPLPLKKAADDEFHEKLVSGAEKIAQLNRQLGFIPPEPEMRAAATRMLQQIDFRRSQHPNDWRLWYAHGLWLISGFGDKEKGLHSLQHALSLSPREDRIKRAINVLEPPKNGCAAGILLIGLIVSTTFAWLWT